MKYVLLILVFLIPNNNIHAETRRNMILMAIDNAADLENIPRSVMRALCDVESSFNPNPPLVDDGGSFSHGLFQVKLKAARHMGFKGKISTLNDPTINAMIAAKYLRYQLDRYKGDWVKALSAYNAGRFVHGNLQYVNKVVARVFNAI